MVKNDSGWIWIVVVVLALAFILNFTGVLDLGSIVNPQSTYEFDKFGYHWECSYSGTNPNVDSDFSDGTVSGETDGKRGHHDGAIRLVDGCIRATTSSYTNTYATFSVSCQTTNFSSDNISQIVVDANGVAKASGRVSDPRGKASMNVFGLNKEAVALGSVTTNLVGVTLKRLSSDTWVAYDAIEQKPVPSLQQLKFSVSSKGDSGGSGSVTLNICDITEIEDLTGKINLLELTLEGKIEYIKQLNVSIQEKQALIDSLELSLADKVAYIKSLEDDIGERAEIIELLEKEKNNQAKLIQELTDNLDEQAEYIEELTQKSEEQAQIIAAMELNIQDQAEMIQRLTDKIDEQAIMINQLSNNLETKAALVNQLTAENEKQAELIKAMKESFANQGVIIDALNATIQDDAEIISRITQNNQEQAEIISGMKLKIAEMSELINSLNSNLQDQAEIIANLKRTNEEKEKIIEQMTSSLNRQKELVKAYKETLSEIETDYYNIFGSYIDKTMAWVAGVVIVLIIIGALALNRK